MSAYLIATVEVSDPSWLKEYSTVVKAIFAEIGAKYHVRSTAIEKLEGENPAPMSVTVIEFPSMDVARDFYNSPEYQRLVELRKTGSKTEMWLTEGV